MRLASKKIQNTHNYIHTSCVQSERVSTEYADISTHSCVQSECVSTEYTDISTHSRVQSECVSTEYTDISTHSCVQSQSVSTEYTDISTHLVYSLNVSPQSTQTYLRISCTV